VEEFATVGVEGAQLPGQFVRERAPQPHHPDHPGLA